jgi:hypothetical protein
MSRSSTSETATQSHAASAARRSATSLMLLFARLLRARDASHFALVTWA